MMMLNIVTLFTAFCGLSSAAAVVVQPRALPNETDGVTGATCTRKAYNFTSTANRTQFNLDALGLSTQINQTQLTELFVNYTTAAQLGDTTTFPTAFTNGTQNVTQSFNISGVYCEPTNGTTKNTLQILIHGVSFDSSYWNFGNASYNVTPQDYSYVYAAAQQGYATFRFDRLGTGESERPADGYNVVQAPTEVGILIDIASKAKNSTTIGGKQWNSTVLVGHSYGSAQAQAVTNQRPDLVDGVVLTGFSAFQMGQPLYLLGGSFTQASTVFPDRFADAPPAWLVTGSSTANQQNYVYAQTVTPGAFNLSRATEQPVTQGAFFTLSSLVKPAPTFKGPVYVVLGEKDVPFAAAAATQNGTSLAQQAATTLYAGSSNATSVIVPLTGHGLAVHTTANQTNADILSFLAANKLV